MTGVVPGPGAAAAVHVRPVPRLLGGVRGGRDGRGAGPESRHCRLRAGGAARLPGVRLRRDGLPARE